MLRGDEIWREEKSQFPKQTKNGGMERTPAVLLILSSTLAPLSPIASSFDAPTLTSSPLASCSCSSDSASSLTTASSMDARATGSSCAAPSSSAGVSIAIWESEVE